MPPVLSVPTSVILVMKVGSIVVTGAPIIVDGVA